MNYHNKQFKPISNSSNGDASSETLFHYQQYGRLLIGSYSGGKIANGHLVGTVHEDGSLTFHYHHLNDKGEILTGICKSNPELLENGIIRLHENWYWTVGDKSEGNSVIEEIPETV